MTAARKTKKEAITRGRYKIKLRGKNEKTEGEEGHRRFDAKAREVFELEVGRQAPLRPQVW